MGTTAGGLPYPEPTDSVDVVRDVRALAEATDTQLLVGWSTYVPAVAGVTLGNGFLQGRYLKQGHNVQVTASLTLGTSSAVTGTITFSLPIPAIGAFLSTSTVLGVGSAIQGSVFTVMFPTIQTASSVVVRTVAGVGAGVGVPGAWASGHILTMHGEYEA